MSQILEKSTFIFNMKENKIIVNFGDNKNENYEELVDIIEKFKKKIYELFQNFDKLIEFIKIVKEKIKFEIKRENEINIKLELHSIEDFKSAPIKNIICEYQTNKNNLYKYQDENILTNKNLKKLNSFIKYLNLLSGIDDLDRIRTKILISKDKFQSGIEKSNKLELLKFDNYQSKLESIQRVLKNDNICYTWSQVSIHHPILGEIYNSMQIDLLNNHVDNSNLNMNVMKHMMHLENIREIP